MSSPGSVTRWIDAVKVGDQSAVERLWHRYYQRLVDLAGKRLRARPHLAGEREVVADSALKSVILGAERGRYPRLYDRSNLWRLLFIVTIRKAIDLLRTEGSIKPGGQPDLEDVLDREPRPEEAVQMCEDAERLLAALPDEKLRQIALLAAEGFKNKEIADKLECSLSTVERKLRLIRDIWDKEWKR